MSENVALATKPPPKMSAHARVLCWRYGPEKAMLINLGLDKAANADLAAWRRLG